MKDFTEIKTKYSLSAIIEALLFVAVMPIPISHLSTILNETTRNIEKAIDDLDSIYEQQRGLRVQRIGKKVQLVTPPEFSHLLEDFMGIETTTTLSRASLETLAIIAFRQPVTRPVIEGVRGVNSDGVVRNLLSKGLIEEQGRVEGVGRAILYGTTSEFLNYFGLKSLKELPPFSLPEESTGEEVKVLKD